MINGETVNWGRVVFAGGSHVLSIPALFEKFQCFCNPKLIWVRDWVRRYTPVYWPSTPANM